MVKSDQMARHEEERESAAAADTSNDRLQKETELYEKARKEQQLEKEKLQEILATLVKAKLKGKREATTTDTNTDPSKSTCPWCGKQFKTYQGKNAHLQFCVAAKAKKVRHHNATGAVVAVAVAPVAADITVPSYRERKKKNAPKKKRGRPKGNEAAPTELVPLKKKKHRFISASTVTPNVGRTPKNHTSAATPPTQSPPHLPTAHGSALFSTTSAATPPTQSPPHLPTAHGSALFSTTSAATPPTQSPPHLLPHLPTAHGSALFSTTSMDYCATDLIPFSGIASNDSPLPNNVLSNAAGIVFHTNMNIPVESFPPRPDTVYSEFESAAIAKTLNNMHSGDVDDEDNDFFNEDLIFEEPSPTAKKKGTRTTKKWKRKIKRGQLKEDWATAGAFTTGFNGEYNHLKFGNDPNKQAKLYNKSSPNGSPIPLAIINKLKEGRAMGHCTASCNLNNTPGNPEEYYDGTLHGDLDGGILAHGLKPFCTVRGHNPNSHINGVWLVALARLLMGIQHVYKTHKQDLDKSYGWIAIIVYFVDDPEFDKIRKFPENCQWAKIMQPGYSLEPMAVSEEQHILLVHIDNIPDFFKEIAGHPRLIPPRTLKQKKETRQKWYNEGGGREARQKYYHEGGGKEQIKETWQKWYHEGGGRDKRKKRYHEGGGRDKRKKRYHEDGGQEKQKKWYYEDGGQEIKQRYDHQRKLTAAAKGFDIFSTSGVFPKRQQCDCGKTFKFDCRFQRHIVKCPYTNRGFHSSQQLLIKSEGMSATSCKNDHIILWCTNDVILWHKLKSALKAMRLPLSDLIVNMFSNARQQERVDRLKTLIKIEKDRPDFAQDKKMIANYESTIEYLCITIKLL